MSLYFRGYPLKILIKEIARGKHIIPLYIRGNPINKLETWKPIIVFVCVVLAFSAVNLLIRDVLGIPTWNKIDEYQQNIVSGMITGISVYRVVRDDWKLDELAIAMANAQKGGGYYHPKIYRNITLEMETKNIEPQVDLYIATQSGELHVYFQIHIMRNGKESFYSASFSGEELNEWARSVGIVRE